MLGLDISILSDAVGRDLVDKHYKEVLQSLNVEASFCGYAFLQNHCSILPTDPIFKRLSLALLMSRFRVFYPNEFAYMPNECYSHIISQMNSGYGEKFFSMTLSALATENTFLKMINDVDLSYFVLDLSHEFAAHKEIIDPKSEHNLIMLSEMRGRMLDI